MNGILHKPAVTGEVFTLIAVFGTDGVRGWHQAIHRIIDIEIAVLLATDHIAAVGTVIFKIKAKQHLVVDATPVNVTVERQLYRVGMADSMGGGVGLARQHASFRIQSQRARLIVTVTVTAIGVGQRAFPAFIQHLINLQGNAVLIAARGVIAFVEATIARRIHRFAGTRIDDGTAIERHQILHMLVGNAHRGALAEPHQRRCDHRLTVAAEVAPVVGLVVIDNHPISES
ncbi:hypothetical protein D3C78_921450 [compost metagenome]